MINRNKILCFYINSIHNNYVVVTYDSSNSPDEKYNDPVDPYDFDAETSLDETVVVKNIRKQKKITGNENFDNEKIAKHKLRPTCREVEFL